MDKSNLFCRNQVDSTQHKVKHNETHLHYSHFYYATHSSLENEWLGRKLHILMSTSETLSSKSQGNIVTVKLRRTLLN